MKNIRTLLTATALFFALGLSACTITGISPELANIETPDNWSHGEGSEEVPDDWLAGFHDPELRAYVTEAISKNHQLAEQRARMNEARQAIIISAADQYPEVTAGFDAARRQSIINETSKSISSSFELGLDLNWEIDLWGKLNDAERQSLLLFHASEAEYETASQQLAANVARAWYQVLLDYELLQLFSRRYENLQENLDIIDQSYRQGISDALDIYLTRDTVEQEAARVASQKQQLIESSIDLQLLVSRYPNGRLELDRALPVLTGEIQPGLPSSLIQRRPDLQQAWFTLLANDAALAVAHKNRFPSLSLVASGSDVSDELGSLLDGSSLAWSLLGSLVQPVFNAGRLKATEEQARSRVIQAEKQYLDRLLQAFSEVESSISNHHSLTEQYDYTLASEENAVAAYSLSFEQYLKGLVTYTTVLESQRRAFDAESSVLDLRNQLLQNRINLYLALGGEFSDAGSENQEN